MLKLSRFAQKVLQEDFDRREIVPELCRYLTRIWPERISNLSEKALFEKVRHSCLIARGFELRSGIDLYCFVALDVIICPGFYERDAIASVLRREGSSDDMRMFEVLAQAPFRAWSLMMKNHP